MSNLVDLKLELEQLNTQLDKIEVRSDALRKREKNEKILVYKQYFDVMYGSDYLLDATSDEVVRLKSTGSSYSTVDIYYYSGYGEGIKNGEISMSSFRADIKGNPWIGNRFQAIETFVQIAEDFNDDIVAALNKIRETYSNISTRLFDESREVRKAIRALSTTVSKLEKEELLTRLFDEDGILLSTEAADKTYLPSLQAKWDWELNNVAGIRGLKRSASGKSIDIEVKRRFRDYSTDGYKYESTKVERVRLDNVERFLNVNSKYLG